MKNSFCFKKVELRYENGRLRGDTDLGEAFVHRLWLRLFALRLCSHANIKCLMSEQLQ